MSSKQLYKHGIIVLGASFAGNVFAYLYHLASARLLGSAAFGELFALLSLFAIFSLPFTAISTLIVRYSAVYNARREFGKLSSLYSKYFFILFLFGLAAFILLLLLMQPLTALLNLSNSLSLLVLGIVVFFTALSVVPNAMINGLQRFLSFSALMVLNPAVKLALAFALMVLGFGYFGALGAIALASLMVFVTGFFLTKKVFFEKKASLSITKNFPFLVTVLLAFGGMTLYTNVDVLFVKHFFSSTDTGVYAVASEVARIVFFLTSAISLVLLPKASEAHSKRQESKGILYKTLGFVAFISIIGLAGYFLFPEFIVTILFGKEYAAASFLVPFFGLGMAFYALSNVMVYYFVSIGRKLFTAILWFFLLFETTLLYAFHSSLFIIVLAFLAVMMGLFFSLFAYSFFDRKADLVE